jgi:hypothetical protein
MYIHLEINCRSKYKAGVNSGKTDHVQKKYKYEKYNFIKDKEMKDKLKVTVIISALNEESTIHGVTKTALKCRMVNEVICGQLFSGFYGIKNNY